MSLDLNDSYEKMQAAMASAVIEDWEDISAFLDEACTTSPPTEREGSPAFREQVAQGAAFYTYDYGIDGVSIEITKYAQCLENMFG